MAHPKGADKRLYATWQSIKYRCKHNRWMKDNRPTYDECSYCPEWGEFTPFEEWALKQKNWDIWQLDKDLLIAGNKVYSPETCVFVPAWLNTLDKGSPKGYQIHQGKYRALMRLDGKTKHLGMFNTAKEAQQVYIAEKLMLICRLVKDINAVDVRIFPALRAKYMAMFASIK